MKTMTREEAILAMIDGKEVTSDEFNFPDEEYSIYDKTLPYPFRYMNSTCNAPMGSVWDTKVWRLRKYIPKDKELCWAYDNSDKALTILVYYDAKFKATFNPEGKRDGLDFDNYAPFDGTPPPNICGVEDLEE